MQSPPRPEYPRPQFRRAEWANLNGQWLFAFDDYDAGMAARWQDLTAGDLWKPDSPFDRRITVPYCFQAELSGIGETGQHDVVWYARTFVDPRPAGSGPAGADPAGADPAGRAGPGGADGQVVLHFGAVDYWATVWVNGVLVATHEGGHTPFSTEIAHALTAADNVLVVRAEDPTTDRTIPRGKQYWKPEPEGIFYTPTTGIWQTVWLEPVPATRIAGLSITPDVDAATVGIDVRVDGFHADLSVRLTGSLDGREVFDETEQLSGSSSRQSISLVPARGRKGGKESRGPALWSPESPNLYALRVELLGSGRVADTVDSYFGMRKVEARDGKVYLNNEPYEQRLVLDQGYFPGGLLTAPSDGHLRADVELAKELGFNGARKHQKVEDPRWLFWADRLGFLVWGEMANSYEYSPDSVTRIGAEWAAAVRRDYNHPCILAWVPMNESWGVPALTTEPAQAEHLLSMYHLTRSLDGTRLVVSNDGWEHARTDLLTLHDYGDPKALAKRYRSVKSSVAAAAAGQAAYVPGHEYRGEPIMITEFGGIALHLDTAGSGWGYRRVKGPDQLLRRYENLVKALTDSDVVHGFCYTQLTDVQQEVNGLLTEDRKPKADPARVREITTRGGA